MAGIADNKNVKTKGKLIKTNRNVKIGSTESYVKKQYGKTSKIKVKQNERFYKQMKYNQFGTDISIWKNYLEYTYKKGSDKYRLRFYLGKENTVTAIVYIRNLEKFYNYPNKELNPGLTFQAPKGKKVTTKTINGKKVYMIPRGTKINFKKSAMSKSEFRKVNYYISMYDVYGNKMGFYDSDRFSDSTGHAVIQGKGYDFETIMAGRMYYSNGKEMNIKKLRKYLYFTLYCDATWSDGQNIKRNKAPAVYYFKFK